MERIELLKQGHIWSLDDLTTKLWNRGGGVHLPAKGGAEAWICGKPAFPLLVVLPDFTRVRDFAWDWKTLWGDEGIKVLEELPLDEEKALHEPLQVRRGETLRAWKTQGGLLVSSPGGILDPVAVGEGRILLKEGVSFGRDELLAWLGRHGYERVDLVWAPGQFVSRGSIVDFFDPVYRLPHRIEFFDENVESLRAFRSEDQKSVGILRELEVHVALPERKGPEFWDFLPKGFRTLFIDPKKVEAQAESYRWLWRSLSREEENSSLPPWEDVVIRLGKNPRLRLEEDLRRSDVRSRIQSAPPFRGKWTNVEGAISDWKARGFDLQIFSMNEQVLLWAEERGCAARKEILSSGFIDEENRLVVLADSDLVGLSLTPANLEGRGVPREWSDQISSGDWVVHEDYGLALFRGLEKVASDAGYTEYLILEFASERRLLIPVIQIHKLTVYPVRSGEEPAPDDLRRKNWKKAVGKSRENARETARTLMETYARREVVEGVPFPPDDETVDLFERSFPFVETSDQLRAIEDVKGDMERGAPMDRLVVGDVGYGKTEVALRAAVKAVSGGKQVALLVPTTILAQQHFETFQSRFLGFPVNVGLLSRFVSPVRQRKTLEAVAAGGVDILIGTHRLLQGDVAFRDLGLLIIDEEHRFGVLHKEKVKEKYPRVDVLTLTATPIPRTLQMSLGGLRDISLISTPPRDRFPVITVTGPWRDDLVVRAVKKELARGGQVFFVHNRVKTIQRQVDRLTRLFPEAKVALAHGQMSEDRLEKAVVAFARGEVDILVCTTIVESGLDIARANTLIVDDAHELGLAQMYQLRGRVGRRSEQAFAFFFYPVDYPLRRESRERLEAISELNDLGSGYNLSIRDLEIRGGGELVGTSQHGHVERVGHLYYLRMLEEEIARLRGEEEQRAQVEVRFPVKIPEDYIPQEAVRLALYRRALRVGTIREIRELEEELEDRFGKMPPAVRFLMGISLLRRRGQKLGVISAIFSQHETELIGDLSLMAGPLMKVGGWFLSGDRAMGPGGFKGLNALLPHLGDEHQ